MSPEDQAREAVVGAGLGAGKFAAMAVGIGFLGVLFGFIPLFGIIIGILVIIAGWKWAKAGTYKLMAYLFGAAAIAASFATMLFTEAAQTGTTTAEFQAQGGVWTLFVPASMTMDWINSALFSKTATTTWKTQQAWGTTPTPTSLPSDGTGGGQAV